MPVPSQDIPFLKSQGWTDEDIANYNPPQQSQQPIGTLGTIGDIAKAHAGGILGGGAGSIGGMALSGAALGALVPGADLTGIPEALGAIIGGTAGALGGGYVGQKAQQAIEPTDYYNRQQDIAQQASEQNPKTALATDIGLSALASGGKPSLNALRSIRGIIGLSGSEGQAAIDRAAIAPTLLQSAINPAINSGINYATTGELPTGSELASQAIGGALFSKQAEWANRLIGHGRTPDEPAPEVNNGNQQLLPDEQAGKQILGETEQQPDRIVKPQIIQPDKDLEELQKGLYHGDEVHATMPDGTKVQGHVIGAEPETGNTQIITDEGKTLTLPEQYANQVKSTVEAIRSQTPESTTPVAEGESSGIQKSAELSDAEKEELQKELMESGQVVNSPPKKSIPYGFWVSPEGKMSAVNNSYGHDLYAVKDLNSQGGNYEESYSAYSDRPAAKDYESQGNLRVVYNKETNTLESDSNKPFEQLTNRQKEALQDYAIYNDINLKHYSGLNGKRKQDIHTVNSPLSDYNRYTELNFRREELVRSSKDPEEIMASPEYQKINQELEEIKNRNKGLPPPEVPENRILNPLSLQEHILSGKATTGSVLHGLANTPNHELAPLAKELYENGDTKSLGVKWNHDPSLDKDNTWLHPKTLKMMQGLRSHYDPITDRVNIGTGSAGDSRVVLEEAIHSLTSKKIPHFAGQGAEHYNRLNSYLKTGSNPHVKDLIHSYFETAKHLGLHNKLFGYEDSGIQNKDGSFNYSFKGVAGDPDKAQQLNIGLGSTTKYAMGNLDEFIAQALKDPQFQRVLDGIKTTDGRTVMQKIVDAVRKLLGLSPKAGSMLDRVLRSSGELIKQERPDIMRKRLEYQKARQSEYEEQFNRHVLKEDKEDTYGNGKYYYETKNGGSRPATGNSKTPEIALEKFKGWLNDYLDKKYPGTSQIRDKVSAPPKQTGKSDEVSQEVKVPKEEQSKTPSELNLPPDKYMGRFGLITRAVIDKVRDIPKQSAKYLADHMQMAVDKETELKGKWKNMIVQAGEHLSSFDRKKLMDTFNTEMATRKPATTMLTNAAQRAFYNLARAKLDESGKYRLAIGEPVTQTITDKKGNNIYVQRNLKQDPTYFPGMANQKINEVYRNNTDHAAIDKLDKEFHDYNTKTLGMNEQASKERIDNFKKALQGSIKNSDISHQDYFNAHRKAQGSPLPPSFREVDPVRNLERYFDRAAIDASHYEFMEKDPKVLSSLGQTKDAWGNEVPPNKEGSIANNPAVKAGLNHWRGEARNPSEYNESSISSLVSSGFIAGPPLEVHKVVSNTVKEMIQTTNPSVLIKALVNGIMNIKSGYQHAVENGVVKLTARSASQMISGSSTAAERMQSLARIIRRVSTLNDITTKVGAGLVQSMEEVIIPSKGARANAGDITSQLFIRRLDPTYARGKQYSEQEMQQLASRSANYIHGTGDIRSLPAWMLNDSEFSGFFSLAHWSIAQTNNFMKDTYEPALRGDLKPLLAGVFGATIGGYLIKELRQDIQGKKSPIPSLQEIASSDRGLEGNKGLIGYNMIAAMQYAGFGGLLSQIAKYPFDFAYKNNPQGATFPLDEVVTDTASTLHYVSEAIANDPNVNWVDLAKVVAMHTLSTNFQMGRIAINQGINSGLITGLPAEKKELSDKVGQLRRFDMVEGLPYNDIDEGSNPYMNLEQKKFKYEQDLPTAMKELPQLIQNTIQTYRSNPDVMMSKLQALKENQYSTFPSLEKMPLQFMRYLGYLQREEGSEAAQAELSDYFKHKITNEAKSSVVP